jgi:hypothetical protein
MKRILFSAATLLVAAMPIASHAAPVNASLTSEMVTKAVPTRSICIEVIVVTPEGEFPGTLCYSQGGRI